VLVIRPLLTTHVSQVETNNVQWQTGKEKEKNCNEKLFERPNVSSVASTGWLVGYGQTEGKISENLKPEVNALSWERTIR
jgi:hypothetical protein